MTAPPDTAADEALAELVAAVERVRGGDAAAYRVIVERLQRPLLRVLRRYVDDEGDAMDLVQRTLLRGYERLDDLERPAAVRGWLFRIGVNLALNHRRDLARRRAEPLEAADEPSVEASAERTLVHRERMAQVHQALHALSPTQRDVVLLRLEGELEYREIAEQVGSTPGAVRVHFHNAVKRLRALLGAASCEPERAPSGAARASQRDSG